jgi:zinc protease
MSQLNIAALPGPDSIARREFPNGVVGLAYENLSSPSVVVHGWLWAGGIDVPAEKTGLASLTASMLTNGTERRTFADIGEEIESVGAALSISCSGHTSRFTLKCLVEDLPAMMDILTDCLYHPTFPAQYVEKRRGEILTALEQREHNTHAMASLHFSELMYPDHPYGLSQLGYRDTIERLTRDDVVCFYRDHFGSRGMATILVGAMPTEQGLDVLQEAFGSWQGAVHIQAPLPPAGPISEHRRRDTAIPGKTQSDLVLGWIGLTRRDPDFFSAFLANSVLGQFGMMGRVGERVREEKGLAYYAYTSLDAGLGPGPWAAAAGVAPQNVDPAIEAILDEVRRIRTEPVDAQELQDNKTYIVDSLPLRLEGNEGIAAQIATMELYDLGFDYLQRFPDLVYAIPAEDVMAAAQKYMDPEAFVLSVAGPPLELEPPPVAPLAEELPSTSLSVEES